MSLDALNRDSNRPLSSNARLPRPALCFCSTAVPVSVVGDAAPVLHDFFATVFHRSLTILPAVRGLRSVRPGPGGRPSDK